MNVLLTLSLLAVVSMFAGIYKLRKLLLPLMTLGLAGAGVLLGLEWNQDTSYFGRMLVFDNYAIAFSGLMVGLTFLLIFLAEGEWRGGEGIRSDVYALFLFTLVGGIMMASFGHMAMLFLGIETLSIALYILAGTQKLDLGSNEASLKYFLMGSFSTGFLLFGIALMYAATGTFYIDEIRAFIDNTLLGGGNIPLLVWAGALLTLTGLCFKVAAVPFHFWAPDVYTGAPTPISAFMMSMVKAAGFAALYRYLSLGFYNIHGGLYDTLWVIAAATMLVGSLSAAGQKSVKRMLAWSSIANAGFMLIAVVVLRKSASASLLYYLTSYGVATLVAFGVLLVVERSRGGDTFAHFTGLARSRPGLAIAMTVALLSLAGIPPVAGFFAKYILFTNAMGEGYTNIVLVGVFASLVGIYYYFRVIVVMYAPDTVSEVPVLPWSTRVFLILGVVILIVLGLLPTLVTSLLN